MVKISGTTIDFESKNHDPITASIEHAADIQYIRLSEGYGGDALTLPVEDWEEFKRIVDDLLKGIANG